jgi:adenylate cyclase
MNEKVPNQRSEGLHDTKAAPDQQKIADTALTLGRLASDFSQVTRIPRHIDSRHENDAEHTFMLALVASAVAEKYYPELSLDKVERFSLVHDLPEVRVGDINTFDVTPAELAEKERREQEAVQELLGILPPSLSAALEEYERQDVPEAVFVRAIDKILPSVMGITGDGLAVVREDFGITTLDNLVASHTKVRERLHAKFGGEFPHIIGAHAVLCAIFEERIEGQINAQDKQHQTPERTFEVERKYLVELDKLASEVSLDGCRRAELRQGYIAIGADGSETRVRSIDDERFELTVKTPGMIERGERSITITRELFDGMWGQTEGRRTEKTRFYLPFGAHTIELDIYKGHLTGLATAEVEFGGRGDDARLKAATFTPPEWFGVDVSEDARYKNRNLSQTRPHDIAMIYANL